MKTTHTMTMASLLLVAVAILAVGSATREFHRKRTAELDTAAEIQRYNELQRRTRDLAAGRARASAGQDKGDGADSLQSEGSTSVAAAHGRTISSESNAGGLARVADHASTPARPLSTDSVIITATDPELRTLNVKIEEARVELDWGPLFALLKLSPERIEQFKRIRMALRQDSMEYEALADTKPLGMKDPEIRQQLGAGLKATEQQMKEILTPEEFRIYNEYYHAERYVSATVTQLASELYFTEAPLSAEQGLRLLRMFAENTPRPNGFIQGLNPYQLHTNIDGALAQMSTPEFSPLQIAMVRKLRDQQQVRREIDQMLGAVASRHPGVDKSSLSYLTPSLPPRKS